MKYVTVKQLQFSWGARSTLGNFFREVPQTPQELQNIFCVNLAIFNSCFQENQRRRVSKVTETQSRGPLSPLFHFEGRVLWRQVNCNGE